MTARQPANSLLRWAGAVLAAAAALAAGAYWARAEYVSDQQGFEAELVNATRQAAGVVHQDLRDRMVGNDRTNVRYILGDADKLPGLQRVMVIGPNGHVYLDSWVQSQNQSLTTDLPGCAVCHRRPDPPTLADVPLTGGDVIRAAAPIWGGTICSSCHVSNGSYLGVVLVDVSKSAAGVDLPALRNLQIRLGIAAGIALILGPAAFWLFHFLPGPVIGLRLPVPVWRPHLSLRLGWISVGLLSAGLIAAVAAGLTARMESEDSFCASCHAQPETTYVARAGAAPVDLASAHAAKSVLCIDCHSSPGVVGRGAAMAQGARNLALFTAGQAHSPAPGANRMDDANCLKCHADVTASNKPDNHFHYYLAAWRAQAPAAAGCTGCHAAHPTGGQPDHGFVGAAASDAVCEQCHAAAR